MEFIITFSGVFIAALISLVIWIAVVGGILLFTVFIGGKIGGMYGDKWELVFVVISTLLFIALLLTGDVYINGGVPQ